MTSKIKQSILAEAINELISIQDIIRWAFSQFNQADLFFGHGTDNSWDEAVALVLQSLDLPNDIPESIFLSRLTSNEKTKLIERIGKRINNQIPLAYLTNKAYFCGLEFFVDERVLVPRSPIAELIENQFQPWIKATQVNNILDLCTGSGCIAIACAQYFPNAMIDASDISTDCIDVAEVNREKFGQDNLTIYQSDLFNTLPQKKYDIIVSNPPYVDAEDFNEIPNEFLAEPKLGLVSGLDGLDITRKILKQAGNFLSENGILVVEVGNSALALEAVYPHAEFTWLEFERGGEGVFLLTKKQLDKLN